MNTVFIFSGFPSVIFTFPLRVFKGTFTFEMSFIPYDDHERIKLSHSHIFAILGDLRQHHPITLFVYLCLHDIEHASP